MSPSAPSTPPPPQPLPLLRAVDERQWGYLSVVLLRHFPFLSLTLLSSRTLAFSNGLRLGICFTKLKERFIREGDLTGRVVHPWFTWFMAVMGVHLHQESRHEWQQLKTQRQLTQVLLTMIIDMKDTAPRFDLLHAWYFMAMSCTYTHTLVPGRRYLMRCEELVKSEDMRLVEPTWIDASTRRSPSVAHVHDHPPEYTEKKHELVSVLANLMYLQCMHCLLYGRCHGMFADLEAQLPDFAVRPLHIPSSKCSAQVSFSSGLIRKFSIFLRRCSELAPFFWFGTCFCISIRSRHQVGASSQVIDADAYLWSRHLAERMADGRSGPHGPTWCNPSSAR